MAGSTGVNFGITPAVIIGKKKDLHLNLILHQEQKDRLADMAGAVRCMVKSVGEDPDREGLVRTPERAAKAFMFFTKGYEETVDG